MQGDRDNVRKSWGQIMEGEEGKDRRGRLVCGSWRGNIYMGKGREEREDKVGRTRSRGGCGRGECRRWSEDE